MGGAGGEKLDLGSSNVFSQFLTLLLAEKSGIGVTEGSTGLEDLEKLTASMAKKFEQAAVAEAAPEGVSGSGS